MSSTLFFSLRLPSFVPCLGFSCTPHTGGGAGGESLAWRPPAVAVLGLPSCCLPAAFLPSPIAPSLVTCLALRPPTKQGQGQGGAHCYNVLLCTALKKACWTHNTTHFLFFFPFVDLLPLSPSPVILIHRTATATTPRTPTEPLRQSEGTRAVRRYQRRRKQGREQARWQSLQGQHRVSTPSASSSQG